MGKLKRNARIIGGLLSTTTLICLVGPDCALSRTVRGGIRGATNAAGLNTYVSNTEIKGRQNTSYVLNSEVVAIGSNGGSIDRLSSYDQEECFIDDNRIPEACYTLPDGRTAFMLMNGHTVEDARAASKGGLGQKMNDLFKSYRPTNNP